MIPGANRVLPVGLLLLGLTLPGVASGELVLTVNQEANARALVGLDSPDLGDGYVLDGLKLQGGEVQIGISGPTSRHTAVLYPSAHTAQGIVPTSAGGLLLPKGLPPEVGEALLKRLRGGRPLGYREVGTVKRETRVEDAKVKLDAVKAETEAKLLADRVTRRLQGESVDVTVEELDPIVREALVHLRNAKPALARERLAPTLLGQEAALPMGALSTWIAAQGLRIPASCEDGISCALTRLKKASTGHFTRLDPGALDLLTNEPRALVALAQQRHDAGATDEAAAALWMALAAPLADPDAVDLARKWGWTQASPKEPTHLPRSSLGDESSSGGPWLWFGAIAFLFALGLLMWKTRSREAIVVGLGGVLGLATWLMLTPTPASTPQPSPDLKELALGRGANCELGAPWITPTEWRAAGRCGDREVELVINGSAETGKSGASLVRIKSSDSKSLGPWRAAVESQVRALEETGWKLSAPVAAPEPSLAGKIASQPELVRQGHVLGAVVAAIALPCFLFLLWQALQWLFGTARLREERLVFGTLLGVAFLIHLLAPAKMVMVFGGYDQVHRLAEVEPLRYGPGATWIYGPWLWLTGPDHGVVQGLNRFLGLLSLPLLWALVGRLVPDRPRVPLFLAAMTVLAPILWRDHASESILVGGVALGLAGLWGLSDVERPTRWFLAIPCLVLSALTRPELAIVLPVMSLGLILSRGRSLLRGHLTSLAPLFIAAACVGWVHVTTMDSLVETLRLSSALPAEMPLGELLAGALAYDNLAVAWSVGPALLLPLFLIALAARRERWLVIAIVLIASFWAALTRVDLPEVSIPRVHAPIWLLLAAAGAIGVDLAWDALDRAGVGIRRGGRALLAAGWVATAALTLPGLYAPTNEDAEEELIQEARDHLEHQTPRCLATVLSQDPPDPGKTSRAFPNYLFTTTQAPLRILGLSELGRAWPECGEATYALLGMRCHAAIRDDLGQEAPDAEAPITACSDFYRSWDLQPIVERKVPNRGDLAFPMYPKSAQLRVGFYRVKGPAGGER